MVLPGVDVVIKLLWFYLVEMWLSICCGITWWLCGYPAVVALPGDDVVIQLL